MICVNVVIDQSNTNNCWWDLCFIDNVFKIVGRIHALYIIYLNDMTGSKGLVNMTKIFHRGDSIALLTNVCLRLGVCNMGLGYRVVFCNAQMKSQRIKKI